MKTLALFLLAALATSLQAATPTTESAPPAYAELLKKYATPGGVRYAAWKANAADVATLKATADFYDQTTPPAEKKAALAWHLNAYNAWILRLMVERYPVKGPLAADAKFFDVPSISVSGKKMSFNNLEQKIIRPTFKEPRVHFALNCASTSCPPLSGEPFTAANLETQLESLTRTFINTNPRGVKAAGRSVQISKLFDWYADDFGGKGQAVTFINRFRTEPIPAGAKVQYFDYDWSLNETK